MYASLPTRVHDLDTIFFDIWIFSRELTPS